MNHSEFKQFLEHSKRINSDSEKLLSFIRWCNNKGIEEVLIRLSGEEGGWMRGNFFLDFTTSRIIASKKSFRRRLVDTGFIAGMAPLPYTLLTRQKNQVPDFRKGIKLNPSEMVGRDNSSYIWYSELKKVLLRRGVETVVTNMLGTALRANFLTMETASSKQFTYRLPVRKNDSFERMSYWLKLVLPIEVSVS